MTKKEIIWRTILQKFIESRQLEFTQKDLAADLGVSLSTVFNSLKIPRQAGAIKVTGRNFSMVDLEKLLYIWSTQRNLEKEIIYETNVNLSVKEIEGLMPSGIIFAAYSAYVKKFGEVPADYDKVYIYADAIGLSEVKKRFPKQNGRANLFVLKSDSGLRSYGQLSPTAQIFCDLWNLKDWYAKDFLRALKEKIIPS